MIALAADRSPGFEPPWMWHFIILDLPPTLGQSIRENPGFLDSGQACLS